MVSFQIQSILTLCFASYAMVMHATGQLRSTTCRLDLKKVQVRR